MELGVLAESKNKLQEFFQKKALPLPTYQTEEVGVGTFSCAVTLCNGRSFSGVHNTKKQAEKVAAANALGFIIQNGWTDVPVQQSIVPIPIAVGMTQKTSKESLEQIELRENHQKPKYSSCEVPGGYMSTVHLSNFMATSRVLPTKADAEEDAAYKALFAVGPDSLVLSSEFLEPKEPGGSLNSKGSNGRNIRPIASKQVITKPVAVKPVGVEELADNPEFRQILTQSKIVVDLENVGDEPSFMKLAYLERLGICLVGVASGNYQNVECARKYISEVIILDTLIPEAADAYITVLATKEMFCYADCALHLFILSKDHFAAAAVYALSMPAVREDYTMSIYHCINVEKIVQILVDLISHIRPV